VAPYITLRVNDTEHKIDCDPDSFSAGELNGIERNTGMTWVEWFEKLSDKKVSSLAWTGLAWIAERRAGSFVPFDEFEDRLKVMELITSVPVEEAAEAATKVRRPRAKPDTT
jgi:hypothetical protein